MSDIDFLIIGAQKAGTTSLFEYMRRHPQIHMPRDKEVGFFNVERTYRRGKEWYLSNVLRDVPAGAVCGEASVGYMRGTPFGDLTPETVRDLAANFSHNTPLEEVIPRRIKEMLPEVRLICVLRDPVARAHSHYRMEVLNRAERRTFDQAVGQLMEPDALAYARIAPTRINSYIVSGEYFRILSAFLEIFRREQLLVIFSDDLIKRRQGVLNSIFEFVGVAGDYLPDNLDIRYRTAATKQQIPGLNLSKWQSSMARVRPLRLIWHALPGPVRETIDRLYSITHFRVAMWNARRDIDDDDNVSLATRRRLMAHYTPDSEALAELLGVDVPWLSVWDRER